MYPKVILSHPFFFGDRARYNFGEIVVILSVTPTVSCSAEQSFSILQRPKTTLRSIMGQDLLRHLALLCIERAYVNRIDFQPILDQKTLVIYFGSCKKGNISLSY